MHMAQPVNICSGGSRLGVRRAIAAFILAERGTETWRRLLAALQGASRKFHYE
jgi:hypothetical protein